MADCIADRTIGAGRGVSERVAFPPGPGRRSERRREGSAHLVEVVVLPDELLELRLHVDDLLGREVELDHRHPGLLEVLEEADLGRLQEQETPSFAVGATCRPADAVDVVARVVRRVELDDPVDGRDLPRRQLPDDRRAHRTRPHVQTPRGDVGADERPLGRVAELEEGVGPLLLLLLSVQVQHRQVDVVEQLGVVLDAVAAGEEDDDLLPEVALEEGEQKQEALVRVADDVALLEAFDGAVLLPVVDVDVQRARPQRDAREVLDLGRLRGREQHGLPLVLGQDLDDLAHLVLESDLEDPIGLVDDERLQVLEDEALGVLQVVEEPARRRHHEIDAFAELLGLGSPVGPSDDDRVRLGMVGHQLASDAEDLQRKLARGRDHDDTGAWARQPSTPRTADRMMGRAHRF